jgi:hypothetical protein
MSLRLVKAEEFSLLRTAVIRPLPVALGDLLAPIPDSEPVPLHLLRLFGSLSRADQARCNYQIDSRRLELRRQEAEAYTARDKLDDLAICHRWRHDGRRYAP